MTEEIPCSFSDFGSIPCHKQSFLYSGKSKLISVRSLSEKDQEILKNRTGVSLVEEALICSCHYALLISKFEFLQKKCCNPFGKDKSVSKKGLRPITASTAATLLELTNKKFQIGQKLCPRCRTELRNRKSMQFGQLGEHEIEDGIRSIDAGSTANNSCDPLVVSPLRLRRDTASSVKRISRRAKTGISNTIAAAAEVNPAEMLNNDTDDNCQKCNDLYQIIEDLKEKFKNSDYNTKIQILTLAPSSWTIEETAKEFNTSSGMVEQAKKLKMEGGVLAVPDEPKGKTLRKLRKKFKPV